MHGKTRTAYTVLVVKTQRRNHMGYLVADERMLTKNRETVYESVDWNQLVQDSAQ
jgi:hypothetical protein